jgi:hypothetical protein
MANIERENLLLQNVTNTSTDRLGEVRLDNNEVAVFLITEIAQSVKVHYCAEPEVRGYIRCNGPDCVLCRAGKRPDLRSLLPVYLPVSMEIAVVPITPSLRPGALKPQIYKALQSPKPVICLVRKELNNVFVVSLKEVPEGQSPGQDLIADFLKRYVKPDSDVDLASIYQQLDNTALAEVPGIQRMLELKGITL